MQITFGYDTETSDPCVLCHGETRGNPGEAVGPSGLIVSDTPGVVSHELVGADRVAPEHVRCDRGTVQFSVSRTFETIADALAYVTHGYLEEPREGFLKFGEADMFNGNVAAMTGHQLSMVGVTVVVNYSFEG